MKAAIRRAGPDCQADLLGQQDRRGNADVGIQILEVQTKDNKRRKNKNLPIIVFVKEIESRVDAQDK